MCKETKKLAYTQGLRKGGWGRGQKAWASTVVKKKGHSRPCMFLAWLDKSWLQNKQTKTGLSDLKPETRYDWVILPEHTSRLPRLALFNSPFALYLSW